MKKIQKFLVMLVASLMCFTTVYADPFNFIDENANRNTVFEKIKDMLVDLLGFARWAGLAICVIMLIWCAVKLATSAGNMQKRSLAMEGIKNVLIATAIIGSATALSAIAYGLLKK